MKVLGLSLGHDSNLVLVADGLVLGVMEAERYFRQKRYKLSCSSLDYGKRLSGYQEVDLADVERFLALAVAEWGTSFDAVAVQCQGRRDEYENTLTVLRRAGISFGKADLLDHHLCHAALAFYTSPFDDALVFSYDGFGNDGHTICFRATDERGLEYLERSPINYGQTYNNLGFIVGIKADVSGTTAGKTMGLAAYGSLRADWLPYARRYLRQYRKLPYHVMEGVSRFGGEHRINSVALEDIPELQPFVVRGQPEPRRGLWARLRRQPAARSCELRLPGSEHPLAQDLVHTVQAAWTESVLEILRRHRSVSRRLCVVGGCALNGITNYAIQQSGMFEAVHFVPNPSDCGLSAGAALHVSHAKGGAPFRGYGRYFSPYLGQEPFDLAALSSLKGAYPHRDLEPSQAPEVLAQLLACDRLVGVMRGRYEIGPRALGNRSILCNPMTPNVRDLLNQKVKHREWFRPFAPVAPAEDAPRYFTATDEIPYMSVICYTQPEYAARLPGVTHVDGSARLQTIRREHHPFLYDTLKAFERLSGVPILLNTSFNPRGEPIINYCAVGLEMLKTTDLDLVLIEDTLFCRPGHERLLAQANRQPAEVPLGRSGRLVVGP